MNAESFEPRAEGLADPVQVQPHTPAAGPIGLLLFAHGARDPRWAKPFERIRNRIVELSPDQGMVELAYLEFMQPGFSEAVDRFAAAGVCQVNVVPVFFAASGHVLRDLPSLVKQAQEKHVGLKINVKDAVGENDEIIEALALYALSCRKP